MWLAWLLAIGTTGYLMWKISGTSVRVLWIIPGVIWDDWRHQPQVLCSPPLSRIQEQDAWLALFEKQYPNLAALPLSVLYPQPLPFNALLKTLGLILVSISPLLIQLVLTGNRLIALQILSFIILAIITSVPLIRWAGMIVGGRYTAWIAYHAMNRSQVSSSTLP